MDGVRCGWRERKGWRERDGEVEGKVEGEMEGEIYEGREGEMEKGIDGGRKGGGNQTAYRPREILLKIRVGTKLNRGGGGHSTTGSLSVLPMKTSEQRDWLMADCCGAVRLSYVS